MHKTCTFYPQKRESRWTILVNGSSEGCGMKVGITVRRFVLSHCVMVISVIKGFYPKNVIFLSFVIIYVRFIGLF